MKKDFSLCLLALSAPIIAVASQDFQHVRGMMSANKLFARQNCGVGDTCSEACGAGWETCDHDPYCYDPTAGDTCCGASGHYCPAGQFCAPVDGYCCDNGQDPATCAVEQGFTLPATTVSPATPATTATPDISETVVSTVSQTPVPATTATPSTTAAATTTFAGPATFTGGAVKVNVGLVGQLVAVAAGLGRLI